MMAPDCERALFVSADALIGDLSSRTGWDVCAIEVRLSLIPDNMLCLLDSPQGWTALADYVAAALGEGLGVYAPTIH